METRKSTKGQGTRFLAVVALELTIVLQIVLIYTVIQLNLDLKGRRGTLATIEDIENLAYRLGPPDPTEVVLQSTCTNCHPQQSSTNTDRVTEEIRELVGRMIHNSGAQMDGEATRQIEAALTLLKCARCHSIDQCKKLGVLNQTERWGLIVGMIRKPGGIITLDDARLINDYYQDFPDWYKQ